MRRIVLTSLLLASSAACVGDLGKGRVEAEVNEPAATPAAAEAAPAPAATGTQLAIDPARSSLRALGAKITATHPIDFPVWSGTVTVDGDTLTGLSFEADMASLVADHPKLTAHLKDADFFDVATYPKATFVATKVEAAAGEGGSTHAITGDLTIRGVTKSVTFPATVTVGPAEVAARTEFVLNRQDFAVTYPGRPDDLVQDKVVLTVAWTAARG